MTGFRMSAMSIRAKLALILGVTIFALAATRALGLSQLDGFLDRFKGYTDRLAVVQTEILDSHRRAASPGEIERLAERFKALRAEADAAREAEASILNRTYLTMLILVFGAGVVAYLLIVALITRPLARVAQVADTVARGDLRSEVRVESDDELGRVMRALRDMNVGLAGLIGKVRGTSRSIAAGSDEIASANADFAEQMAGQSAALEQTAAAMTQLSTGIGRAAGHAREASARAEGASGIAAKGGEEVARVAATMRDIEGSARRITEITAVIDGIAFQTNLLALNAAVEAARAGAHGRGFAVVATEVRNLAQKSATAAREVRTLIEDSLTKVELGAHAVESAGRTMSEIVDNSRDVTRIVGEIASLAGEQAHAVEEVNRAVSEMDRNTRRNTELIERAARTAQEMRGHSIDLNSDVSVFLLADADDAAAADGAPAAVDRPARYPGKTARLARLRASFSDQS